MDWSDYMAYIKLRNLISQSLMSSNRLSKYLTGIISILENTTFKKGLKFGFVLTVQFFTRLDLEVCTRTDL